MLTRSIWRVVEEPCLPGDAKARWRSLRQRGAAGAVTSWGSGIRGRSTVRAYWEVRPGTTPPPGEELVEENWTPYWRESLRPVRVTERMVLAPAWELYAPEAPCVLRIDPGMAFGAGDHPTTRLCLRFLEHLASREGVPPRVLDVGTGTGVLALATAHLGAEQVDALDIDPFCYAACRRNAALNGLEGRTRPLLLSLDLLEERYPLVLGNLVASQIEHLGPLLRACTEPGGRLLVSGFEVEEGPRVAAALGMPQEVSMNENGWLAVALRRPAERDT